MRRGHENGRKRRGGEETNRISGSPRILGCRSSKVLWLPPQGWQNFTATRGSPPFRPLTPGWCRRILLHGETIVVGGARKAIL